MKRAFVSVTALLLVQGAVLLAQGSYGFMGLHLGMTLKELNAFVAHSHWAYEDIGKSPRAASAMYGNGTGDVRLVSDEGYDRVRQTTVRPLFLRHTSVGGDTVHRAPVRYINIGLFRGRVYKLVLYSRDFTPDEHDSLVQWMQAAHETMTEKYGPPETRKIDWNIFTREMLAASGDSIYSTESWRSYKGHRTDTSEPVESLQLDMVVVPEERGVVRYSYTYLWLYEYSLGLQDAQDIPRRMRIDGARARGKSR